MRRSLLAALLGACLLLALLFASNFGSAAPSARAPKGFFGIGPQTGLTPADLRYMKAGGIESLRLPVPWNGVEPEKGVQNWTGMDEAVALASQAGLRVLPFIYGTPPWLSRDWRRLAVDNAHQRAAWRSFLRAAVARYGPGGEFWDERAPGIVTYEPAIPNPIPIREWQIGNEVNFFYFAYPVSVGRYARLVKLAAPAIRSVDPKAKIILSGLFGEPTARGKRGMDADDFLARLYKVRGIKSRFDGVALHPYAVDAETLEEMIEGLYEVARENRDRPGLYVTEMGWGSESNFEEVAFEQGVRGQVKQLRDSYAFMLENSRRLNLKAAYWFSWKDLPGSCTFCDSAGLFRAGPSFRAKPAWHAFVKITGGKARP
jgi:hypothetical protein